MGNDFFNRFIQIALLCTVREAWDGFYRKYRKSCVETFDGDFGMVYIDGVAKWQDCEGGYHGFSEEGVKRYNAAVKEKYPVK